ncbi:ceramide synthase 6, partial [Cryptotermes secundus]|uniref:ceramide synthase 6 n=1 Tax=Cryptotermes secundus TaxID=105785 RepID=UPI001454E33A
LAKQVELSERQVERWLCLRRSQDKPSTLTKFCETWCQCLYYTFSFSYGVFCLWEKPWLCDINHSWYGYPHQMLIVKILNSTCELWFIRKYHQGSGGDIDQHTLSEDRRVWKKEIIVHLISCPSS